jgi:hypothetical protein
LGAIGSLGVVGLFGVCQEILAQFGYGEGTFRILKASPKLDVAICLALIVLALVMCGTTASDRATTKRRIYGLSKERVFNALTGGSKQWAAVAKLYPDGQMEVTQRDDLFSISVEIRGQPSEDRDPPMFEMADLSPEDAQLALKFLKASLATP